MNEHVVDYRDSGHPAGMVALLVPHAPVVDWDKDGRTAWPDQRCAAISATSNELCGKRQAVVELEARAKYGRVGRSTYVVPLCGGHFNSHRAGRELRVVVNYLPRAD